MRLSTSRGGRELRCARKPIASRAGHGDVALADAKAIPSPRFDITMVSNFLLHRLLRLSHIGWP
jgi:hypothetical protein